MMQKLAVQSAGAANCITWYAAGGLKRLMKRGDVFFLLLVILVIVALVLVVVNIHALFPTPSPQSFAQSFAPVQ